MDRSRAKAKGKAVRAGSAAEEKKEREGKWGRKETKSAMCSP